MKIFILMSTLINILFLNFNNPLILSLLILMQTFNLILMMGKIYYSFWFSYIIFLVFIGGLFILFIYIIALTYNNKFFYYFNKLYILLIFLFFMNYKMTFINNYESNLFNYKMTEENILNLMKLYNFPNNLINLMLILYLFMMMIIVVKLTNFMTGPIRSN